MRDNYQLIVGDNLTVLTSTLMEKYSGKIKLIYIDPPYNTNSQKSYGDRLTSQEWKSYIIKVVTKLYEFLKDDGVLFISIDDNEYANLKLICDEIFSKSNFLGSFITRQAQRSNSKFINIVHEYILCYAKNKNSLSSFSVRRMDIPDQRKMIEHISKVIKTALPKGIKSAEKRLGELIDEYCELYDITWLKNYNCVDDDGNIYFASDLSAPGLPRAVHIEEINLHLEPLKTRTWISDKKFIELYEAGLLVFRNNRPYQKKFLKDARDSAPSILNYYSRYGTRDLNSLGLRDIFDTPKPAELIKFLLRIANLSDGDIVMDCFAGSGTTGQAVMEINEEDGKKIEFILIQKKEPIDPKSLSFKKCAQYGIEPYISEITKLRLNKVRDKYSLSTPIRITYYEPS